MNEVGNIIIMEKLGQIVIDNTINLVLSCDIDQKLISSNFSIILACLKELKANHQDFSLQQISMKDQLQKLIQADHLRPELPLQKQENDHKEKDRENGQNKSNETNLNTNQLEKDLQELVGRVSHNEKNIIDSIKDINLINKDIKEVKDELSSLKNNVSQLELGNNIKGENPSKGVDSREMFNNINSELNKDQHRIKELEVRQMKQEEVIKKMEKEIAELQRQQTNNVSADQTNKAQSSADEHNQIRDDINNIKQKMVSLEKESKSQEKDINILKEFIKGSNHNKASLQNNQNLDDLLKIIEELKISLSQAIEQVQVNEKNNKHDHKLLNEEINQLKIALKNAARQEKIQSNTSLEEKPNSKGASGKKIISENDVNDRLNELSQRITYLQKILGSKTSLEEKNPEKLPLLKRHHRKEAGKEQSMTAYHEKDRSGITRKDLHQLKSELEIWIKSYMGNANQKDTLEDLQLKMQELRKNLDRKADVEGMKKGLTFLENKITQLYLFLTEPETEDAMIVRKGFNCLSCSKKVEKLRGRIGPKLNWNNMTATNYSPPRVGYSKPENTMEKQDDL